MTRYEELTELGNACAVAFEQAKLGCWDFAGRLAEGLAAYLGCPAGSASYHQFHPELAGDQRWGKPIWDLGMGKAFPFHEAKLIDDGYWCIGLEFSFGDMVVRQALGVKPSGDCFLVRLGGKGAEIQPGDDGGLERLFDAWYAGIKEDFRTPIDKPRSFIGFRAKG